MIDPSVFPPVDKRGCLLTGLGNIFLGPILLILGIAAILLECEFAAIGCPIWGGAWFVFVGVVGLMTMNKEGVTAQFMITMYLVGNVFAVVFTINMFLTMWLAIESEEPSPTKSVRVAIDMLILGFSCLEFLVSCWGVGVASRTVCTVGRPTEAPRRRRTVFTTRDEMANPPPSYFDSYNQQGDPNCGDLPPYLQYDYPPPTDGEVPPLGYDQGPGLPPPYKTREEYSKESEETLGPSTIPCADAV